MKKVFISVIDSLYYLFTGEQEDEPAFKEKAKKVLVWFVVIAFCVVMLKLFIP
jgi:hypothetical protein